MTSSFILAYGRSLSHLTIAKLWEALATVPALRLVLRHFSASLLILSFPSFLKVSNCSVGKLVSLIDEVFAQQHVGVALSTMENSKAAVQAEIKNRQPTKDREETGLFVPVSDFAQCDIENAKLFM
jgi:hypothetical protein